AVAMPAVVMPAPMSSTARTIPHQRRRGWGLRAGRADTARDERRSTIAVIRVHLPYRRRRWWAPVFRAIAVHFALTQDATRGPIQNPLREKAPHPRSRGGGHSL